MLSIDLNPSHPRLGKPERFVEGTETLAIGDTIKTKKGLTLTNGFLTCPRYHSFPYTLSPKGTANGQ